VIECDHEWIAAPDLLRTLNGVLPAKQRRKLRCSSRGL
jgi:hypothetical protein